MGHKFKITQLKKTDKVCLVKKKSINSLIDLLACLIDQIAHTWEYDDVNMLLWNNNFKYSNFDS